MKRQKPRKRYSRLDDRQPSRVAEPAPSVGSGQALPAKARARAAAPKASPRPSRDAYTRLTRAQRYRKAAALLREWMADDSGYDERIGALLEDELKKDPIRFREEFE
jgi:hypothetical protein